MNTAVEAEVTRYVGENRSTLTRILQRLVQIPSENKPPDGDEGACQQFVADYLSRCNVTPQVYSLEQVPGLAEHPLFWPGRSYKSRPNVGARIRGTGGGRSLVLSGHADTVPAGTLPWTVAPFCGRVDANRLYGRGSNDMKAGIAINLFVVEALQQLGIRLKGDLIFETVVDEEFGGSNGTLAGRLMGFNGDAAIVSEPSLLRICPAQRGGRVAHITLRDKPNTGVLTEGAFPGGISHSLRTFLDAVAQFSALRKQSAPAHPVYAHHLDPVPVAITRISTGPWGSGEPQHVPDTCRIEMYWQAMPGESCENIDGEFFEWLENVSAKLPAPADVVFPIRWLPGSAIAADSAVVRELSASAAAVLGEEPTVAGIEGPCDLYVFQQVANTPAVLWGPRGGNTHKEDEYVEIDSVVDAAKVLLNFVCSWCGAA